MLVALVAVVLPATGPLAAQVTTGTLTGIVTTSQNQPVSRAQIQVVSRSTGFASGVLTRSNGRYTIPGLEVGQYTLTVRRIGYAPASRAVTITLGEATSADVQLEAQAATLAAMRVQAASSEVISPSHTGSVTTFSDSAISHLPTLDRNFTDFVQLTPQVSSTGPGLSGGGTNNRYNNIQIDGSIETDLFGLGSTGQPGGQASGKSIGFEAVKEYQVLLSPYDVRQGNFAGLLVNAVTKSGTNEWHGSLFGVSRNQRLARAQDYLSDYQQSQYGGSIGGPIVKDKVLFFLNPEFQYRRTPAEGPYVGQPGVSLSQAQVDQVSQLVSQYNIPAGSAGLVNNQNPLVNIFGRLDVALPWNTQLVLHHNYGYAEDDIFSRSNRGFRLSSNGYKFKSTKNGTVAQFRTLFGNGTYNELFLDNTSIRDRRAPNGRAPQVSVNTGAYGLVYGSERFSQGNELDQDIQEVTDNYTVPWQSHRFTIGTQNQFYKVRNLFTQASYGVWNFGSLDSLQRDLPNQYIIGVPLSGDGAVRFKAAQYALYAQDEYAASPTLNFTVGLRADVPVFRDKPPQNANVAQNYNLNTSDVPSGNVQWSPRVGFNWDVTGDAMNQLRGGIGMFTGRPAYVWMSNAFQNSGSVGVGVLTCNGARAQPLSTANTASPPPTCSDGTTAQAGGEIDILDPNLKFPQNLRTTLGYDRRVADAWVATVEGMYTKGVNGLFYQNIALAGPVGTDKTGRVIYGTDAFRPTVKPGGRTQIFDVTNQSNDHAYSLTGQLTRRYRNNFEGSVAYTYNRAWDVQSFTSSTSFSQYRFGRAWAGDQSDQTATRSIFEQRNKISAYGTYSLPTKTDISFTYIGASGTPYDYVVNGDANGDGISLNDPIYVPADSHNTAEIQFQNFTVTQSDGSKRTYTPADQANAFDSFINSTPCLRSQRGHLMSRNSCDNPWTNTLNVSARQNFRSRGQNFALELQVFNFLNLVNKDWGLQPSAGFGSQSLLNYRGKTGTDLVSGQPIYTFDPTYQKFYSNNIFSNYQIQLQLRYTF